MSKKDTIGNSPIKALFTELAQLTNALGDPSILLENAEYTEICELCWDIREQIESAPVESLHDLRWKARALQLEADRNPEFDNEGPGSARALAAAVANGAIQLASAAR